MYIHDLHPIPQPPSPATINGAATLLSGAGALLQLEYEGEPLSATRATSCLLEPRPNDRVWCVGSKGKCYVIAVLERAAQQSTTLYVDGDLELVAGGGVSILAGEGLTLSSPGRLRVEADELTLDASSGLFVLEELRATIGTTLSSVSHATRIGSVLEVFIDKVTQRSREVQRSVEGVELSEAGTFIQRVRGMAHIQAKQALVNGTQVAKIDGQQVQLG